MAQAYGNPMTASRASSPRTGSQTTNRTDGIDGRNQTGVAGIDTTRPRGRTRRPRPARSRSTTANGSAWGYPSSSSSSSTPSMPTCSSSQA
jgi:hypothetical protein